MEKHLLAKPHIADLNESAESEVTELTSSTVDVKALVSLRSHRSREITIVSSQCKFIVDIPD